MAWNEITVQELSFEWCYRRGFIYSDLKGLQTVPHESTAPFEQSDASVKILYTDRVKTLHVCVPWLNVDCDDNIVLS